MIGIVYLIIVHMLANTVTPEKIIDKLAILRAKHEKMGNHDHPIGVDTLSLVFNTHTDRIMELLKSLEKENRLCISYRTIGGKRTGKNPVMFVHLNDN